MSLNVTTAPIDTLVLDVRNARKHGRRNLDAIKASLAEFGQRRPLVVDTRMTVIAGNGTLEAARDLGWSEIDVTVVPSDWTAEQARAYALADNRTAELATWDEDVPFEALTELDLAGWDVDALGFDLPDNLTGVIEDEAPEPPVDPVTKPGDVWTLGEHRLLCGDSTDAVQVSRLMASATARMMFTDPPWNVAIGSDSNPRHRQRAGLANDDLPPEEFQAFLDAFIEACRPHIDEDVYCVLGASEWDDEKTGAGTRPPLRPRRSIPLAGVREVASGLGDPGLDGRDGDAARQRSHRVGDGDDQEGVRLPSPVQDARRGEVRDLPLHRGFYNPHRRHSSLGNLSPAEFERRLQQRQLQAAAS